MEAPHYLIGETPLEHMINAFIEFTADILKAYANNETVLLHSKLLAEHATTYNKNTGEVILGNTHLPKHMAAYCQSKGLVPLLADDDESESGAMRFDAPTEDNILVVTRSTRILLDDSAAEG